MDTIIRDEKFTQNVHIYKLLKYFHILKYAMLMLMLGIASTNTNFLRAQEYARRAEGYIGAHISRNPISAVNQRGFIQPLTRTLFQNEIVVKIAPC